MEYQYTTPTPVTVSESSFKPFIKYALIIVLLSLIGFNIFNYLARTTDIISTLSARILGKSASVATKTIDIAEEGAKTSIDIVGGATKSAVKVTSGVIGSTLKDIEHTIDHRNTDRVHPEPQSDDTDSSVQAPRKTGYCYIGAEKGFRSCMYVGENDHCMSNQVYPTMEVCINPNLRV